MIGKNNVFFLKWMEDFLKMHLSRFFVDKKNQTFWQVDFCWGGH